MEINDLTKVVMTLVAIGMLLGVGLVIFSGFGTSSGVWMTRAVTSESVTWPDFADTVTLAQTVGVSISSIKNDTTAATLTTDYTYTTAGVVTNAKNTSTCFEGDTCYVTYTWVDKSPAVTEALSNVSSSAGSLATNWLSIIVIVVICSLVLGLVIKSFMGRR